MTSLPLIVGLAALAAALGLAVTAQLWPNSAAHADQVAAGTDAYSAPDARLAASDPARPDLPPVLQRLRGLARRVSPKDVAARLQYRLDLAGNPTGWTADRVLAYKGLGLVVGGLCGLLVGLRQPALAVVFIAVGVVVGCYLPDVLLRNAGEKRQIALRTALPDALDLMTVCVEAGLGFDAALAQVARKTEGPMAAESSRVLQEMQFGKSRVAALRALGERTTVRELRVFISALVQASELGIPIASVLREQANEMRIRRRQNAEERAQKVPIKILFPLLFCLLPAMFVVVLGPAVINIYHTLVHGVFNL